MKFTGERFIPNELLDKELELEHLQRYYAVTNLVKDKVVLDAACGEGYGSEILSSYANQVYGIDVDNEAIEHAKESYQKGNLEFIQSSIEFLPLDDNSVDVVVSFETIEHVDEVVQSNFLKQVKRVLKEDGLLVISTPNKYVYSDIANYKNEFHVKEFYAEEFYGFLGKYFKNINFYHQRPQICYLISDGYSMSFKNSSRNDLNKKQSCSSDYSELGKYIIAVCTNADSLKGVVIDAITVDTENKYQQLLKRVLQLQSEVEERNLHIQKLDEFVEENDLLINHLNEVIEKKQELTKHKNELIDEKNQIIKNQQGQIEQLLEKERALNNILQSRGWRMLQLLYWIEDRILPLRSKRRIILKIIFQAFRNPYKVIRGVNLHKVKQLLSLLKNENFEIFDQRWEQFTKIYLPEKVKFKIAKPKKLYTNQKLVFKQTETPQVSIVIPVYNQWEYTYSCLESILINTEGLPYEVIIADDMSTDETTNISKYIEGISIIKNKMNLGFLRNCNNAAEHARGKYILFLNNDTNVQKDWLKYLVDLIEKDEKIGLVGAKLVYGDGRLQEAGGIIWNDASGWNYGRLDSPEKPEFNYVKEVDYISGACIMIRSKLWNEIEGFDERFAPAYFEDTDLAFEVRKRGFKVIYQPKSVVVHFEGISHGTDTRSNIKRFQLENKEKFSEKWKGILIEEHLLNGQDVFWSRDRSRSKKTIVVIDHYVPRYNRDAGGRCTFQYIKLFTEMGMNVKFIGDNFVKHEPYASELEQIGVEVLYGNWYAKNIKKWIKNNGQYFDYVYLNRPHISIKYIDIFKKYTKAKIIYFGHDLHYLRELRQYQIEKREELLKSSETWRQVEFELFGKCDVIHVVGSYEQAILRKEFQGKAIRNIPLYIYDNFQSKIQTNSFKNREDILFVGGFNHKPNLDAVLWFTNNIFPRILDKIPTVKFYIVGSNPPPEIKMLSSHNVIVTGSVSDTELENYYNNIKVVVVPLRFGAGVKGKVIEALYSQVPVVTTNIGAEGITGIEDFTYITDDEIEYATRVVEIYNDELQWIKLSLESIKYVERYFSKHYALSQIAPDFN